MNRVKFAAALLVTACAAAPAAAADFSGPRGEVRLGWTDVSSDNLGDTGQLYGLGLGYDFTIGDSFVVGAEAVFDWLDADSCEVSGGIQACFNAKRDITVALRGGYKVLDSTLLYARAGYANARIRGEITQGGVTTGDSENGDGYVVGAGAEQALGPNLFAKVEYGYSNYEAGLDRHQVMVGFGYRFPGLGF